VKPWEAEAFEWDDGNDSEFVSRGISQAEVESVFEEDPVWAPNKKHRAGDWRMIGRTVGGRALTIILTTDETRRVLRPITGWDCTEGERTRYLP
jgi:hypothetical protein